MAAWRRCHRGGVQEGCRDDRGLDAGRVGGVDRPTALPTTYAHLLVVCYLRSDRALTVDDCQLRFNNDTGANYDLESLRATAATPVSSELFAQTSIYQGAIPAASATANVFGGPTFLIPNYANATNQKMILGWTGHKVGTTTGLLGAGVASGFWRSNAAINRITLFPVVGPNFVAGSRVSVYALGV